MSWHAEFWSMRGAPKCQRKQRNSSSGRRNGRRWWRLDGQPSRLRAQCASPAEHLGRSRPTETRPGAARRRASTSGVSFIDTADSYGPDVSEELIAEALYPYPEDLVIATKGGLERPARGSGPPTGGPSTCARRARAACDAFGWTRSRCTSSTGPTRTVPLEDSIGALRRAQGGGQDPPHRAVQRQRGAAASGPGDDRDRVDPEPLQPGDRGRSRWSTCASRRRWSFCRGRRSRTSTESRRSLQQVAKRHEATVRQIALPGCWPGHQRC